ncbi:uncharacterized protein LOC119065991 [Bradysia coprophila]|uniref:uncharacterized protein LOC119065991 n=1 Tax=Bradysia coprophila TaxID=38358 RepID=UPI00187DC19D|nr:uncharacterized protein LOC119065991 [Bradysia coprophila]
MERNVRQLEVIFPVDGDLQKVNISTVYSYVENFGPIVSCEKSSNGLDMRMIEADGVPMNWFNRYHEIDGYRVRMRREMHILDLPLFCLKVICKWLLNSIDDLCSVTEVCTTLKDAAILTFEGEFSKSGARFALKNRMQADIRLFQCFLHSITRLEINAEDREHFTYILASLKKMSPNNVLKYLNFSNKRNSNGRNHREYVNHFSHLSTAEVEDLFSVFSHLEGISYNTWEFVFPRLPPNLRILSLNFLYDNEEISGTSHVINANLQKIVIRSTYIYSLAKIAELLQSSPQIKEITIYGWEWGSLTVA